MHATENKARGLSIFLSNDRFERIFSLIGLAGWISTCFWLMQFYWMVYLLPVLADYILCARHYFKVLPVHVSEIYPTIENIVMFMCYFTATIWDRNG